MYVYIYIYIYNIIIVLPRDHGGPTPFFKWESSPTILRGAVDYAPQVEHFDFFVCQT